MKTRWNLLIILLALILASCMQDQVQKEPLAPPSQEILSPPPTDTSLQEETTKTELGTPLPDVPTQWDDMPKDPPLSISKSPGPQVLIERVKADLAQRLSVPASQIKAMEAKEVSWPDASIGCPQPGIVYPQTPTPGYLVVLEYAGKKFEYHASTRGAILYCKNPTPPISEPTTVP